MALRAYLYVGNLVEFAGKKLDDLIGVCQHAHEVSLVQKLLVGNSPQVIPSLIFDGNSCVFAERAGTVARVLGLLDRMSEGEVPDRDAFLATSGHIRDFLRDLPHTSHVLLEPAEVYDGLDIAMWMPALVTEIEASRDRVTRAIRGEDEGFLAELRRDWRTHFDSFWSRHLWFSFRDRVAVRGLPDDDEKPKGRWIAPGAGNRCATCIGTLRTPAIYDAAGKDIRTLHIACALWTEPRVLRAALDDVREGAVVEPWVAQSLAADPALFTTAEPTFAALLDDPDDVSRLAAFAERLSRAGDPYGELVAASVASAASPSDYDLIDRKRELQNRFAPGAYQWGISFQREASIYTCAPLRAPYNTLLTELRIGGGWNHDELVRHLPRSLRRLAIAGHRSKPQTGIAPIVGVLPRLTSLSLDAVAIEPIAHPTLRELSIGLDPLRSKTEGGHDQLAELLRTIVPADLPSVVELAVRPRSRDETAAVCAALAEAGWLAQLERLVLSGVDASVLVAAIVPALGSKRLAIELDDTPIASALVHALRAHADVIAPEVVTPTFVVGARIEHTGKPEWGTGKVKSVRDGKVEIVFGKTSRTFKTDAIFLRVVE